MVHNDAKCTSYNNYYKNSTCLVPQEVLLELSVTSSKTEILRRDTTFFLRYGIEPCSKKQNRDLGVTPPRTTLAKKSYVRT